MAKERFYLLAVEDTADYYGDMSGEELPDCVAAVFGVYLIREGERTHIASTQPNSAMISLAVEPVFYSQASEEQREDIRNKLDDWLTEGGGRYDMDYYGFVDFARLDRRRIGAPIIVNLNSREYKGGLRGDAYHKAIWDAALEEVSTNQAAYEPAVLAPEVFEAYRLDHRMERNGKGDERPLQHYQSGAPLPLFAHAAQAGGMAYEDVTRLRWY